MENWLKFLIASACCVVIAGGAYFAWSEYQAHAYLTEARALESQRVLAERAREDNARKDLVRAPCLKDLDNLRAYDIYENPGVPWSAEFLSIQVHGCLATGILNDDDVASVMHRLKDGL